MSQDFGVHFYHESAWAGIPMSRCAWVPLFVVMLEPRVGDLVLPVSVPLVIESQPRGSLWLRLMPLMHTLPFRRWGGVFRWGWNLTGDHPFIPVAPHLRLRPGLSDPFSSHLSRTVGADCFMSSAFLLSVATCMWVLLSIPAIHAGVQVPSTCPPGEGTELTFLRARHVLPRVITRPPPAL